MQETIDQIMSLLTPQMSLPLFSGFILGPMIIIVAYMAHCLAQYPNTSTEKTVIVCVAIIGFMIWMASLIFYISG